MKYQECRIVTCERDSGPFSRLLAVQQSGRLEYIAGMIKNASVCENKQGNAAIRLGNGSKMPCYWVTYADDQHTEQSFEAYFYKNVPFSSEKQSPNAAGDWTSDRITLDQLLQWALTGAFNA